MSARRRSLFAVSTKSGRVGSGDVDEPPGCGDADDS
jgi:hypothetical protein